MDSSAWTRTRPRVSRLWLCLFLPLLAACSSQVNEPQTGAYRAVLELPGGAAPFGLEVAKEKQGFVLYLVNGEERTRVDTVKLADHELTAMFPGSENTLRARMYRNRLEGEARLIQPGGAEQVIPFQAKHGETYRFYEEALTDNADLAGRWEMTLINDGQRTPAVAVFQQQHDRVSGTVTTPSGEHRFLEGQVHGDEAQLSAFAGDVVYLYKLSVNDRGELEGDFWQGLASHAKVTAVRNEDATLEGEGV
jgi:hypothetical protein